MKKLAVMIMMIFGLVIGLGFGTQQASASHYQTVFPKFARGVWYEYNPHHHNYNKIKIYRHRIVEGHWKAIITSKAFDGSHIRKNCVYVSGHKFTAPTSDYSSHSRASMVPGYWRVIHKRGHKCLASAGGAGFGINDTYAFRSRIPYQARFMYY
ncbi:hypothetical protein [Lentilactobacillus kisonensis]|uniref:Uncharacterized protein n=1 Tax=Lentilactobacillus kisonensis DSM 19906 = JCM 15041 TaxID=1423766 RepID=A0A0R1NRN0_9LACO|nr:hypothetical protein [Lentilactobacillus kisonensis]KRL23008.1 hypothetical protein FC98_GL001039 [Lentilactobacillus kisonensis DSM 19906 = JCM 15041]